jgi:hypothetical protein
MKGSILGRCLHKSTSFGHSQHVPCNFSCNQTSVRPFLTEWTLPMICNVPYLEGVCTNPHPLDIHKMSRAIFHAIRPVWDPFSPSGPYPWFVRFHTRKVFAQVHILWSFPDMALCNFSCNHPGASPFLTKWTLPMICQVYIVKAFAEVHILWSFPNIVLAIFYAIMQAWAPFSLSELYPWAYWYETSF